MVTVSIAMATYNGEKYLKEQLDSLLSQTVPIDEIIIVDDFSTDGTLCLLNDYARVNSNIKVFSNSCNLGVEKTFVKALGICTGNYIAFCDQDDIWHQNKIQILLENIQDNLLIFSSEEFIDENSNPIYVEKVTESYSGLTFYDILLKNRVRGCCSMISREILKYGYPDYFYIHDHYFALLAASLKKIKFIPNNLIKYRLHQSNTIGVQKYSYDRFVKNSLIVADSYDRMLRMEMFKASYDEIILIRDYRRSIYTGRFLGCRKLFRLLQYPNGFQLVIYYLLIGKVLGNNISRFFYKLIHRVS